MQNGSKTSGTIKKRNVFISHALRKTLVSVMEPVTRLLKEISIFYPVITVILRDDEMYCQKMSVNQTHAYLPFSKRGGCLAVVEIYWPAFAGGTFIIYTMGIIGMNILHQHPA